jgi:hypothetical protein
VTENSGTVGLGDGGGIAAVILVMMGEENARYRVAVKQPQHSTLHVVLTGVDDDVVDQKEMNAHQRRADRPEAELECKDIPRWHGFNDVHS